MLCRRGDDGNGLDSRGAGADLADAFASEIDARMRPESRMVCLAFEAADAWDVGEVRGRETADGGDEELCGVAVAGLGLDGPAIGLPVEGRADHARAELDVGAEVEAVCNVVQVTQDFRLFRIPLGPLPFLFEFR